MNSIAQGDGGQGRYLDFTYNSQGYPAAISDGLGALAAFEYDLAGRVTRQELADGREIRYGYDANGNLTSITPPGRTPHLFTYTATDRQQEYLPPEAGTQPAATRYAYRKNREKKQGRKNRDAPLFCGPRHDHDHPRRHPLRLQPRR